jgi:diacylglycerol kinase (ATP)
VSKFGYFHDPLSINSLNLLESIGEQMIALVVNPNAGGRVARTYFASKDFLNQNSIEHTLVSAESPDQARAEIGELAPEFIVAIGGDGTLHSLTGYAVNHKVPLVLLPSGSGNDSARKLGLTGKSAEQILTIGLLEKSFTEIDVMRIEVAEGTFFSTGTISAGLDSKVNQRTNSFRFGGFLKYPFGLLRELPVFEAVDYELVIDGKERAFKGMLCSVSNSGIFGGGMKIVPAAQIADGNLELFTVAEISKPELLKVFPRVYGGTHLSHPAVGIETVKRVSLSAEVPIYADGEPLGFGGYDAEVIPKALTIAI